ncbi:MAG: chemotaxis protein CheA, partial [Oscillospiraceae bacterium]|nr:chemotaxis protein CheA [Oscillospiraceae bacterium]
MDNTMDSMLDVYLFEAKDLLEHLDGILINCERESHFDSDSINEIFRIMHTIKGSSAMMQFNSLATISHKIEDLFYYVRESGMDAQFNDGLFDLVFRSSDFLKEEIAKVESNQPLNTDIGTFEQEINEFLKKISQEMTELPQSEESDTMEAAEDVKVIPSADDDEYPYAIRVNFDDEAKMENLRAFMLINVINETYRDITYTPEDIQTNPDSAEEIIQNGFIISFKNPEERQDALKIIENFMYTKNYTVLATPAVPQAETKTAKQDSRKKQESKTETVAATHTTVKQNLINVNLSKLDNLMDLMGEIVITESMVTSTPGEQNMGIDNNFSKASRQLRKLTDELQEIVMSIRMV